MKFQPFSALQSTLYRQSEIEKQTLFPDMEIKGIVQVKYGTENRIKL